jgi:class 3 adenylate cyclase
MYGEAMRVAGRAISVTSRLLADREGGVFVTRALRERLPEVPWHDRLQFQALELSADSVFDSEVYRLSDL